MLHTVICHPLVNQMDASLAGVIRIWAHSQKPRRRPNPSQSYYSTLLTISNRLPVTRNGVNMSALIDLACMDLHLIYAAEMLVLQRNKQAHLTVTRGEA